MYINLHTYILIYSIISLGIRSMKKLSENFPANIELGIN